MGLPNLMPAEEEVSHRGFPFSPKRVRRALKNAWQRTPLYGLSLSRGGQGDLHVVPMDSWPGSQRLGRLLVDGTLTLGNESLLLQDLWKPKTLSVEGFWELHSFEWLRHLRTLGDNGARRLARHLISHWIEVNTQWKEASWRMDILGQRIANWIGLYDFFCASADEDFRQTFFKSLHRQIRHLIFNWQEAGSPTAQLFALHGLIHGIICLNIYKERLPVLMDEFTSLMEVQIGEDGGHRSRSPKLQLMVLRLLIDLRSLLRQSNLNFPRPLQLAIYKMTPMVRFFRQGDGSLACFGPHAPVSSSLVDMVLSLADARGRPPFSAAYMGYERAQNKTGMLLLNVRPSSWRSPWEGEAEGTGLFNFEWGTQRHRIITYSDVVLQNEEGYQPSAVQSLKNPLSVVHEVYPEGNLLQGEYQNLKSSWVYTHSRRLFLSNKALDLRGEDILSSQLPCDFAIRFVFHPHVALRQQGKHVWIQCPSGQTWALLTPRSLHVATCDDQSSMIVLLGRITPQAPCKIKWCFKGDVR